MSSSKIKLPITDKYVHVQLLNGGSMTAECHKIHAGEPADRFRLYNWAFYVYHPTSQRHIIWDLGLTSDPEDYAPAISNGVLKDAQFEGPRESIPEQIKRRNGVTTDEIDTIIFSHAHFDHCRPVRQTFPNGKVLFGPGTSEHCSPGHLTDASSIWDGRFFDPKQATERWETLEGPWLPYGPFDRAMDLFGDASFWIIQAPGHMPGNLCACAKLAMGEWVVLGSDCCHSRYNNPSSAITVFTERQSNIDSALLDGTKEFGTFKLPDGSMFCLHSDISAAKDTLARMRGMESLGAHIALAHDTTWMEKENDPVLLSLLDAEFLRDIRVALRQQAPF